MHRTEYVNDPDAPAPNSVVVAASIVVSRPDGKVLLVRRTDNDTWTIPGGGLEPGESIAQTAIRECREESGLTVHVTGLVGVYSNPRIVVAYPDGEVRQQFSVCLIGEPFSGTEHGSSETSQVGWFDQAGIAVLEVSVTAGIRLADYFGARARPVVD